MRTKKGIKDTITGMLISRDCDSMQSRGIAKDIINFLQEEGNLSIPPIELKEILVHFHHFVLRHNLLQPV